MNKLIGAFLIFLSCFMTAAMPVYAMKQRLIFLSEFRKVLLRMNAELRLNLLPIPDLIEIVSATCGGEVRPVFTAVHNDYLVHGPNEFQNSWYNSIKQNCPLLTLEEQECLCSVGAILGQFSLDDELAALDDAAVCLQLGYSETRSKYLSSRKLFMGCGSVTGLMIAIALL